MGDAGIILKKDFPLFKEGDIASALYIVKSGRIIVVKESARRLVPLKVASAREFVGEESILTNDRYETSAIAIEDCEVVKIERGDLTAFLKSAPDWALALIQNVTARISSATSLIAENMIVSEILYENLSYTEEFEIKLRSILKGVK